MQTSFTFAPVTLREMHESLAKIDYVTLIMSQLLLGLFSFKVQRLTCKLCSRFDSDDYIYIYWFVWFSRLVNVTFKSSLFIKFWSAVAKEKQRKAIRIFNSNMALHSLKCLCCYQRGTELSPSNTAKWNMCNLQTQN